LARHALPVPEPHPPLSVGFVLPSTNPSVPVPSRHANESAPYAPKACQQGVGSQVALKLVGPFHPTRPPESRTLDPKPLRPPCVRLRWALPELRGSVV
jgi:hypothetical protein